MAELLSKFGRVCDAELCRPLQGVRLYVNDESVPRVLTDADGRWTADLPAYSTVRFESKGCSAKSFPAQAIPDLVRLLNDRLIGYHDSLYTYPGEKVAVRVHALKPWRATLCRHGYKKQIVLATADLASCRQDAPDGRLVERGLSWRVSHTYHIPKDICPGLYSLQVEFCDNSERFNIPLIVSTPPPNRGKKACLLVLASTATWQSYNIWGGRSRYRNFEETWGPAFNVFPTQSRLQTMAERTAPRLYDVLRRLKRSLSRQTSDTSPQWMHRRLSVQRPFTNCGLDESDDPMQPFTNHLAAGEWRILAWLERERIAYDIVTAFELDQSPDILESYRAVVLSTHCEYWTRGMYESLRKQHLHNGLAVLNLSGNSIYRLIEFYDDESSRCVHMSFADSCADETEVLSVRFSMSDYGSCAPYCVVTPDHELWVGCELPTDGIVGRQSLNTHTPLCSETYNPGRPGSGQADSLFTLNGEGASGWETDKRAPDRVGEVTLLAKGQNAKGGADLVCRMPDGRRGLLFSASSLTYGGALLIDPVLSRLTLNAIEQAGS